MSLGDRLGIAGLILGAFGVGCAMLWPTKKWIGWLFLSIAIFCLLWWGIAEYREGDSIEISGSIPKVIMLNPQPPEAHRLAFLVFIEIRNAGMQTALADWRMQVNIPGRPPLISRNPDALRPRIEIPSPDRKATWVICGSDSLYEKTAMNPVPARAATAGVLIFSVDASLADIRDKIGTTIAVTFNDVTMKNHELSTPFLFNEDNRVLYRYPGLISGPYLPDEPLPKCGN